MENKDQNNQSLAERSGSSPSTSERLDSAKGSDITAASKGGADEISLKEIILKLKGWNKYLLSKSWIIIIACVFGGVLGLVYSWKQVPIYKATTTFVLESNDAGGGGLGQYAGIASMVGIDLGGGVGGIFQGDNIIELYRSRTMIEKTLLTETVLDGKKQLIMDRFINLKKGVSTDIRFNELNNKDNQRSRDSIIGATVNDINKNYLSVTKPDKKLSIIKVEVKAKDEELAKVFNEQIVKNVNDFYVQTKTKKSLDNVKILQQKTDSVRAVMNGAIYTAASISDATPNLNPTRQVQRVAPMQRSSFSVETNKAILGELIKNLEMSKISLRHEMPLIQVIDKPIFPLEKESFSTSKGFLLGVMLFGFLSIFSLIIKRIYKNIMSDE